MMEQKEPENLWGYAKRLRFVRQTIASAFPRREPGSLRVLDVGCGNGSQLALPLARRGFRVAGVDTHAPSIEHARRDARDLLNARFVRGRVEDLDPELFDVVILSEVLEHVTDPSALLAASAH
jgi:2-polyprenyl-3-methyl-5-hydroxy-6-metoxy-1,4-benzoquinol methylase